MGELRSGGREVDGAKAAKACVLDECHVSSDGSLFVTVADSDASSSPQPRKVTCLCGVSNAVGGTRLNSCRIPRGRGSKSEQYGRDPFVTSAAWAEMTRFPQTWLFGGAE